MKSPDQARPPSARASRSDGGEARARLLLTALKLFAQNGFAKTSTREIAQAAEMNIAAISYYFGDKAGLYRAAFTEPMGSPRDDIPLYDQPGFTLRQSLDAFMRSFLEPMKQGELVQQCTRLHFREMLEPSSLWQEEIDQGIRPAHAALVGILCRHLRLAGPDEGVHRLSFAIVALPIHMYVCRDIIEALSPGLIASESAIDDSTARLADFAEAMVNFEAVRRASAPGRAKSPALRAPLAKGLKK